MQQAVAQSRARFLGKISADPAFSDDAKWPTALRELDASPVMRLHRGNQQPAKRVEIAPGVFVASFVGRVYCECAKHTGLLDLRFPKWPFTKKELRDFWDEQVRLKPFEWWPNGEALADGRRPLLRPHGLGPDGNAGGCEHCVHAAGAPVRGADGRPRPRCCTKPSKRFKPDAIPFFQRNRFGSRPWYKDDWSRRNIVEGTYGIIQSSPIINFGNDYHRHVGLAHETIIGVFVVCAYNRHMLRTWRRKRGLAADTGQPDKPKGWMTVTLPPPPQNRTKKLARGPKGLENLGSPRAGP